MLNNKFFKASSNSESGEVSEDTVFHYRQDGTIIWGTYRGGEVKFGTLSGYIKDGKHLVFHYQHLNQTGTFKGGVCNSEVSTNPAGKIVLHEKWEWTLGGEGTGQSVLVEFDNTK